MKNFVWISPHFPKTYYHFALSLKRNGFRVLGIGDESYDNLLPELKENLTEYYRVNNMEDFDEEIRAVRFFEEKYGHIDYLESNNEYWLSRDARLREIFHIDTGLYPETLSLYQHKSSMKKFYENANCPVANYLLVKDNREEAYQFIKKYGYPVFAKPDIGVGADETFKIRNKEDLESFFQRKDNHVTYIMEQFLSGTIVSFDGMSDNDGNVLFCTSEVFPPSVSDVKNEGLDFFYYCLPEVPEKLKELGKRVIKSFHLVNRFFHCEYFLLDQDVKDVGQAGDYVGLEVNLRTPGGYTPDLLNYANSVDCYQIYADSMAFNATNVNLNQEKYYAACASRRDNCSYFYSDEEIFRTFHKELCQSGRYPDVFSGIMGNRYFMAKFKTLEEVEVFRAYVNKHNPDHEERKIFVHQEAAPEGNICDTNIDGA